MVLMTGFASDGGQPRDRGVGLRLRAGQAGRSHDSSLHAEASGERCMGRAKHEERITLTSKKHILVVDDEPAFRTMLTEFLGGHGSHRGDRLRRQ